MFNSDFSNIYPDVGLIRRVSGIGVFGSFSCEGRDRCVEAIVPNFPALSASSYHVDGKEMDILSKIDNQSGLELPTVLKQLISFTSKDANVADTSRTVEEDSKITRDPGVILGQLRRHDLISSQLAQIGWNRIEEVNSTLTHVQLSLLDRGARCHKVTFEISSGFPSQPPNVRVDLPEPLNLDSKQCYDLADVYQLVSNAVDGYQSLWNVLDRIDNTLDTLSPRKPLRSHCYRRLLLTNGVTVLISLDPHAPACVPSCRFYGASRLVAALRERLGRSVELWDEYEDVIDNLQRVLDVTFVKRSGDSPQSKSVLCGVCLSDESDDVTMTSTLDGVCVVCDNVRCQQHYHTECLFKWLQSRVTARHTSSSVCGECPYCHTPISCPVPVD